VHAGIRIAVAPTVLVDSSPRTPQRTYRATMLAAGAILSAGAPCAAAGPASMTARYLSELHTPNLMKRLSPQISRGAHQ
jgi:hypothetical protein